MTEDQVLEALRDAVADECMRSRVEIRPDMTAAQVPGWDSLAHIRIMMNLEARLNTTVDIDRSYRMATLGDLVNMIVADANQR